MSQTTPPGPADRSAPAGAAPAGGADPSMEDILASIRRILSDDEQPAAPGAAAKPASPPAPPAAMADVPGDETDALPLSEAMLVSAMPETAPEPPAAPVAPPPPSRLVAPEAEAAAASSVSTLLRTLVQERDSMPVYRGGPTIEDVVRDEIRPLLKAWLDAHLPPLVERLVRAEIERVVGRVQS